MESSGYMKFNDTLHHFYWYNYDVCMSMLAPRNIFVILVQPFKRSKQSSTIDYPMIYNFYIQEKVEMSVFIAYIQSYWQFIGALYFYTFYWFTLYRYFQVRVTQQIPNFQNH